MHLITKNCTNPGRTGRRGSGNRYLALWLLLHNAFNQNRRRDHLTHRHTMKQIAIGFRCVCHVAKPLKAAAVIVFLASHVAFNKSEKSKWNEQCQNTGVEPAKGVLIPLRRICCALLAHVALYTVMLAVIKMS